MRLKEGGGRVPEANPLEGEVFDGRGLRGVGGDKRHELRPCDQHQIVGWRASGQTQGQRRVSGHLNSVPY